MSSTVPSRRDAPLASHRYLFPVLHLTIEEEWEIGPVRLYPAGSTLGLVNGGRARRGWRHEWYDDHLDEHEIADMEGGTVAVVVAATAQAGYDLVADAVGVLRLFQPTRAPMVDVQVQTFGLAGEIEQWTSAYIDLDAVGAGWFHGGAHPGWTLRAEDHEAFKADSGWQLLAGSLEPAGRPPTRIEARLRLGARLINAALLDYNPDRKLLSLVTGLEVILGEPEWRAKKYWLARRAAFLSCSVPQRSMCGRDRDACHYLAWAPKADGNATPALRDLLSRARIDPRFRCSQYLELLDLYDARNRAIHDGSSGLTVDDVKQIMWRINQWLLPGLLAWCAAHRDADLGALDKEISAAAAARPPTQRLTDDLRRPTT
jgi:hypothetical protein